MRLDFEISRADFENAAVTHWRRLRKQPNPFNRIMYGGIGVAGLGLIVLADREVRSVTWLAPSVLIAVGIGFRAWWAWWAHTQRDEQWRRADHVLGPVLYDFSEEQIYAKGSLSESTMRWELFRSWAEGGAEFLLYQTATGYFVIPKRAFATEADMMEFRSLLRRKIAEPPRKPQFNAP